MNLEGSSRLWLVGNLKHDIISLKGKTPAEKAEIKFPFRNWLDVVRTPIVTAKRMESEDKRVAIIPEVIHLGFATPVTIGSTSLPYKLFRRIGVARRKSKRKVMPSLAGMRW